MIHLKNAIGQLEFDDTSAARARFQNSTGTLEVLQKTKIEFPRWARSVVFLCSHPAWERDFCFLQHLCSESASFSPAKMGDQPRDLCSRFKFIYEKRLSLRGPVSGPGGLENTKNLKKIEVTPRR